MTGACPSGETDAAKRTGEAGWDHDAVNPTVDTDLYQAAADESAGTGLPHPARMEGATSRAAVGRAAGE